MHFHFSVYSSILLIFFSQGIIFSFLLLKKGLLSLSRPSKWLSLFVLLCSIYLLPWMLGFAGWYSLQPYRDIMFYIPFQQLLLIGPVLYFYTQSLLNPSFTFDIRSSIHFVPGLLYIVYRLVIFIVDKILLDQYYFYADGRDKNLDTWYQFAGFISMSVYLLLCLQYYAIYRRVIYQTLSFADSLLFKWIKQYLLAFLVMQVLWLIFFLFYPGWGSFKEKWWYYLSFSSLLYYIAITGYSNNVKAIIAFRVQHIHDRFVHLLENRQQDSEPDTIIPLENNEAPETRMNEELEAWKIKITETIEKGKLYQQSGLTLLDVARELNTNQTIVSKMVNQIFKMNFNDFINEYRVKTVIALLEKGEYKTQTLLSIAMDSGFNSKTTFNRCFKNYTGVSPTHFIKTIEH